MATSIVSFPISATMTDTEFRDIITGISDIMTAGGLTLESDTGQINIPAAVFPGVGNTAAGFQIRKFSDTLQGTTPVFFKIEFGRGSTSNSFAIWITLGKGSNGSGTITNETFARTQINITSTSGTQEFNIAAVTNRLLIANNNVVSSGRSVFGFERTVDPNSKNVTSSGILLAFFPSGNSVIQTQFVNYQGSNPALETTAKSIPMPALQSSGLHSNGNVAVYPLIYYGAGEIFLGTNFVGGFQADFPAGNNYSVNLLGQSQTMRTNRFSFSSTSFGNVAFLLMRFE